MKNIQNSVLCKWWQSKNSPIGHHSSDSSVWRACLLLPAAVFLSWGPAASSSLSFSSSPGHLRRWSVLWPKTTTTKTTTEPVKGHTGESPSVQGPNHLTAKGWWSQGQRKEWCFLTSFRLASCFLLPLQTGGCICWSSWWLGIFEVL